MEPSTIVTIWKTLQSLSKPFMWTADKAMLIVFRVRNLRPWIDSETAIKRAQLTLGGHVIKAVPFMNYKSRCKFIAALYEEKRESYVKQVYLLEKVGGSYMIIWTSEPIGGYGENLFDVSDIGRNGMRSISFSIDSFGSGSGTRHLISYSTETQKLSEIVEHYNYSDSTAPEYQPEITVDGNEDFRERFIAFATRNGFLSEIELPDLESAEHAVRRWHYDNGDLISGKIVSKKYDGPPPFGSSSEVLEKGGYSMDCVLQRSIAAV
jgi:hypothetical protein